MKSMLLPIVLFIINFNKINVEVVFKWFLQASYYVLKLFYKYKTYVFFLISQNKDIDLHSLPSKCC